MSPIGLQSWCEKHWVAPWPAKFDFDDVVSEAIPTLSAFVTLVALKSGFEGKLRQVKCLLVEKASLVIALASTCLFGIRTASLRGYLSS